MSIKEQVEPVTLWAVLADDLNKSAKFNNNIWLEIKMFLTLVLHVHLDKLVWVQSACNIEKEMMNKFVILDLSLRITL